MYLYWVACLGGVPGAMDGALTSMARSGQLETFCSGCSTLLDMACCCCACYVSCAVR